MDLAQKHCVPCEGGTLPIGKEYVADYLKKISGWTTPDNLKIVKEFNFPAKGGSASGGKDSPFLSAMKFANRVAEIAEAEGHHPDIHIFYSKVRIELSTHAIGGLSENDFILAAKTDELL